MFFLVDCNLPPVITGILAQVYKIILIAVPIGIVLFGSIDFLKAIAQKDQENISRTTKTFVSRLITGALTFFVFVIVTWLFDAVIGNVNDSSSALECAKQIITGNSTGGNSSSSKTCSVQTRCQYCTGIAKDECLKTWNNEKEKNSCSTDTNCAYCNSGPELDYCLRALE